MKNIKNYLINEAKDTSVEATKNLIEALKKWYNIGTNEEDRKSNSPYIKTMKTYITSFVKDCIMSGDMPGTYLDKICDEFKLKEEDYESCANELAQYILK